MTRFSLLDLEEGELFFEDYAATLYLPNSNSSHHSTTINLDTNNRKSVSGRLKVASRNLVFEPHSARQPIMRLPFRGMRALHMDKHKQHLIVDSSQIVEMKAHNMISPYVFRELKPSLKYIFEPSYCKLDDFVGLIAQIYHLNKKSNSEAKREFRNLVSEREKSVPFDSSWFTDLDETKQLVKPLIVSKLTPLVEMRGQIQLTQKRIYFQPFQSQSSLPMIRYNLDDIQYIHKRRHMMRHVALELIFRKADSKALSPRSLYHRKSLSTTPTTHISSAPHHHSHSQSHNTNLLHSQYLSRSSSSLQQSNEHKTKNFITYSNDGIDTLLLSFESQSVRDHVYEVLKRQRLVEIGTAPSLATVQRAWMNGEVSNFDYLLFLNQQSGRSFNDLTQYPIFPWVLTDYESKEMDINDPHNYRDMSKPVGALNPERLQKLRHRYDQMPEDSQGGRFMYGSHYSTPGYVMYFLVRQCPEYMLRFQNGRYDTADRLFSSLLRTWTSAYNSLTDVKELVPQFFEGDGSFLTNYQRLQLGMRTDGTMVQDVQLPAWSTTPADFIHTMRCALEHEHCSKQLHQWIDLIWGYKQRGDKAEKADNVFHYLTYEGAVDIDSIEDETESAAIRVQIHEFGQTPSQLFHNPHPPKRVAHNKCDPHSSAKANQKMDLSPSKKLRPSVSNRDQLSNDSIRNADQSTSYSALLPESTRQFSFDDRIDAVLKGVFDNTNSGEIKPLRSSNRSQSKKHKKKSKKKKKRKSSTDSVGSSQNNSSAHSTPHLVSITSQSPTPPAFITQSRPPPPPPPPPPPGLPPSSRERNGNSQQSSPRSVSHSHSHSHSHSEKSEQKNNGGPFSFLGIFQSAKEVVKEQFTPLPPSDGMPRHLLRRSNQTWSVLSQRLMEDCKDTHIKPVVPPSKPAPANPPPKAPASATVIPSVTKQMQSVGMTSIAEEDVAKHVTIAPHSQKITDLCVCKDGSTLYSVSQDCTLAIYSIPRARTIRCVKICSLPLSSICLPIEHDTNNCVAVGSWDGIYIFNSVVGKILQKFKTAHEDAVSCLAASPSQLISGSWDTTVKVWNWKPDGLSAHPLVTYSSHDSEIRCVATSRCAPNILGCGDESGNIFMYDTRNHSKAAVRSWPRAHKDEVTGLCWLPNRLEFVSSSADCMVKHWDADMGKLIGNVPTREHLHTIKTDGKLVIGGGELGAVRLWAFDESNRRRLKEFPRHSLVMPRPNAISVIDVSSDASHIIVGTHESDENTVIFDLKAPKKLRSSFDNHNHTDTLPNANEDSDFESISSMGSLGAIDMFNASNLYKF